MGILDLFRKGPEPVPDRRPLSAPGRAHTNGFLQLEELNAALIGFEGFRTFDRMYRTDGDVRQAIGLVANPLIAGTWDIEPYGGIEADKSALEDVDFIRWALWDVMNPNLNGHLEELLPVLLRSGFTPFEELWTTATWDRDSQEYLVLRKLDLRLPRTIWRWFQDAYGDLVSITQQLPVPLAALAVDVREDTNPKRAINGEYMMPNEVEMPVSGMVYYRIGREGDNWEGVSMLRPAYKHWLMKDAIERLDAIAQEREAVGVPICYPPLAATPTQLDAMEDVLSAMRTNEQGYIIAPGPKAGSGAQDGQGWLIEVIGYERSGTGRDPQPSLTYHTQKIYASVLAEFIRLGHETTGARATAQVQVEPFLQSIEALSRGIEMQLQGLVDKLIAFNRPKALASPKIKLSKIDSTSLTQLADYVLKLSQAGAMLPDQSLEEYLRLRADLPPMDPEAVKARGSGMSADNDARREVLTGGGAFGDAPGGNTPNGGAGSATPKSANKPKSSTKLSDSYYDDQGRRLRFRPYRPQEDILNLDAIEDYLDAQPDEFARTAQNQLIDLAAMLARGKNCKVSMASQRLLCNTVDLALGDVYQRGINDAREEVNTVLGGNVVLSVRDHGRAGVREMAEHASNEIVSKMQLAAQASKLNHGQSDVANTQAAAEIEGMRALRAVALGHGSSAYQQGRHDYQLEAQQGNANLRFLYTALLDNRTCEECAHADDGVPRAADDPVRLDRLPPNRHCLSNMSGHNYCRCLELPVIV